MADQVDARQLLQILTRMEGKIDQTVKRLDSLEERMTGIEKGLDRRSGEKKSSEEGDVEREDVKTAIEIKKSRKVENVIKWNKMDEEIRLAHNARVENSEKPSMWQYNPEGGMPTELANLDPSKFLTAPIGLVFCFLPKNVFVRICSMLSAIDFVDLSLTCRFLHWRMFTFCTCYVPYTAKMYFRDYRLSWRQFAPPKLVYTLTNGDIDYEEDDDFGHSIDRPSEEAARRLRELQQHGQRGFYVYQPFCLRKPFFFTTLQLAVWFPFYSKKFYDRCLPYIMAVRGLARHLDVSLFNPYYSPEKPYFNFSATNDFFVAVNASYYDSIDRRKTAARNIFERDNKAIFLNCPYVHQMDRVCICSRDIYDIPDVPVFQNSIGNYQNPLESTVIATLNNFLEGSTNLIYHEYHTIQNNNGRYPLIEYLFEEFGEFEEFYCAEKISNNYAYHHIWTKVIATGNGGQLKIMIDIEIYRFASVTIGKEELFDEMEKKYKAEHLYREGNIWWKMETAVEPDEVEESDEADELDATAKPDVTIKPKVLTELVKDRKRRNARRDEVEKKPGAFACLCLNSASCSIQ